MSQHEYTLPDDQEGLRLDKAVAEIPSVDSRGKARKAIASGKVRVNGKPVDEDQLGRKLKAGDHVVVNWNQPGTSKEWVKGRQGLKQANLSILFEDAHLIAIDKPPGLLTDSATRHQQRHRDTLKKRLKVYLKAQDKHPFIVHRIDRDTSGVVLVAKTERSSEHLRRQFQTHTPERQYWLAVHGTPNWTESEWVDCMMWDSAQRIQRRVDPDHEAAFRARCWATVVKKFDRASLLHVKLDSGRRNQIRLQAQLRHHPLIGERLYVPKNWDVPIPFARQALHARFLQIKHPQTGEPMSFEAPLPKDLKSLVQTLKSPPPRRKKR